MSFETRGFLILSLLGGKCLIQLIPNLLGRQEDLIFIFEFLMDVRHDNLMFALIPPWRFGFWLTGLFNFPFLNNMALSWFWVPGHFWFNILVNIAFWIVAVWFRNLDIWLKHWDCIWSRWILFCLWYGPLDVVRAFWFSMRAPRFCAVVQIVQTGAYIFIWVIILSH